LQGSREQRKPPVIVVGGPPGSGKSTVAKLIASKYGLRYVSMGSIFREIAKRMGVSLEELSLIAERDPSIDRMIDSRAVEEAKNGCVVIDGHISAWILKDIADVKIATWAPHPVRISRIAQRDGRDVSAVERETTIREESEKRRFKAIYGIDVDDLSVFDIVVNTARFTPEEILVIVSKVIEIKLGDSISECKAREP